MDGMEWGRWEYEDTTSVGKLSLDGLHASYIVLSDRRRGRR